MRTTVLLPPGRFQPVSACLCWLLEASIQCYAGHFTGVRDGGLTLRTKGVTIMTSMCCSLELELNYGRELRSERSVVNRFSHSIRTS